MNIVTEKVCLERSVFITRNDRFGQGRVRHGMEEGLLIRYYSK